MQISKSFMKGFILLLLIIVLSACGESEEDGTAAGTDNSESTEEDGGSSEQITLPVGGAAETSWVYGALTTVSETIKQDGNDHIDLVVQTSPGSVPHPQLFEEGQIKLGSSTTSVDSWAMAGREEFYDKSYEDVYYALMPLNKAKMHIVVPADSDINNIRDLEGKKVFTGDPGTSILYTALDVLDALDIEVDDYSMDRDQGFQYLQAGRVDALMFTLGAPYSSLLELESGMDVKLVPISEEDIEILEESLPDLTRITFEPGEEYDFVDETVTTVANIQLIASAADVPEDNVYEIVKAIWGSWDRINEQVPATGLVTEEDIVDMVAPVHPGAIKYYEEIGIEIPDHLVP
jgi:hypothetical protein